MGDLAARQAALEGHFRDLASARAGRKVFALEHGLGEAERVALAEQLRQHCAHHQPSPEHWLTWTVYAAELGYDYAGREYWQSFERLTPGWQQRGDRGWIRECFLRFAREYSGFSPRGSWAEHFSIICWPIIHAVLPRDLQIRIARILYAIRDAFTAETLSNPEALGALIAARGWLGSARLEQLADDAELIGNIALALLFRDSEQRDSVALLESTVDRIGNDLEHHRTAQEWLKDARGSARRAVISGLRAISAPALEKPTTAAEARRILSELGLHPTVFLVPSSEGWLAMLRPPNLTPLLTRFPELREYLLRARPTVVGSSGEMLSFRRVLQGDQQVPLHSWPDKQEVLLQFEDAPQLLRVLLSAECLLRPGPTWVFRIGSDKVAYELKGRLVHAGHEYLLLTNSPVAAHPCLVSEHIACDGVSAYRLRIPTSLDEELIATLRDLNLSVARAIHVHPVGLAAAGWDGSGFGEWLVGEQPCVVISSDHKVDRISCKLAGADPISIQGDVLKDRAPVFVQFPQLPVGAHIAEFTLHTRAGDEQRGEMELLIRQRRNWAPGLTQDGALTVFVDPPAPTIEDLWSDRVSVDIHGPQGQSVECTVRFWRETNGETLLEKHLSPLPFPVVRQQWSTRFRQECRLETESQSAYDQADGITLDFVSPGIGRFALSAEREFAPLRWAAKYKRQRYHLRLQDDRGTSAAPTILRYSFDQPAVATTLASKEILGDGVEADGGLYVALADEQSQAIIIAQRQFDLQDLRYTNVAPVDPSSEAIAPFLGIIELWSRARQVGSSFSLRLAVSSVSALINALYAALGGLAWAPLEAGTLDDLRHGIEHDRLGREVSDHWADYARMSLRQRVETFEKVLIDEGLIASGRRSPSDPRERLAEVALRFASDPGSVRSWAEGSTRRLHGMINLLLHNRVAARAARFLVLCIDKHFSRNEDSKFAIRHAGWEWP